MPSWKCQYFAMKDSDMVLYGTPVENCGLCINWSDTSCMHHDKLKGKGDNERYKETVINSDIINDINLGSNDYIWRECGSNSD